MRFTTSGLGIRKRQRRNKIILLLILLLIWPAFSWAEFRLSHEERIERFYVEVVAEVKKHGIPFPLAREVAQYGILRCAHEDGLDRKPDLSINGMIPGEPNKSIIGRLQMPDHTLGRARDSDGQGTYVIRGPRAFVMGSAAVALWFDKIICEHKIFDGKRAVWIDSHILATSIDADLPGDHRQQFDELAEKRDKLLARANTAYGPLGCHINKLKEKLTPNFLQAEKK